MLKWATVVGIAALAGTFIIGFMLEQRHVHWIPEAAVGVAMGIFVSGIGNYFHESDLLAKEKFDYEFFMIWLLPPIIFEVSDAPRHPKTSSCLLAPAHPPPCAITRLAST